ncbi:hypothetical protein D3C73_1252590 [compost metagenome]
MPVARCHVDRFTFLILHALQGKQYVTAGSHHLDTIADHELVFHIHFCPTVTADAGEFTDKLLAFRQ